jgi:hypothetical protein
MFHEFVALARRFSEENIHQEKKDRGRREKVT